MIHLIIHAWKHITSLKKRLKIARIKSPPYLAYSPKYNWHWTNLFSVLMNVNYLLYSPFTTFALWCADLQVKVPFELCQSIRLSSLRAWVRFSNWSCRWMFSSISVWIVSCSSKLRLCRTSRASGRKKRCGLSPITVRFQERSPNSSCDRDDVRSRPHQLKLQGRRQMSPPPIQRCGWKSANELL